jgi:hypothetical protein
MITDLLKVEVDEAPETFLELTRDNLGSNQLAPTTGFVLTTSKLTQARLTGNPSPGSVWTDYACNVTSVGIRRGITLRNGTPSLEAGTASITATGIELDPKTNGNIRPGVRLRIRAYVDSTWETIYQGQVGRAVSNYGKDRTTVSIECADLVKDLANKSVDGGVAESFTTRAQTIASSIGQPFNLTSTSPTSLAANTVQGTAAAALEMALTTEQGVAWVDRQNVLQVFGEPDVPGTTAVIAFSDTHVEDSTHACYSDIGASYDSSEQVNQVFIVNETGSGSTTYGPYEDLTSVATWGPITATITTNFATSGEVDAFAASLLAGHSEPTLNIDSLRVKRDYIPWWAPTVEVFDVVSAEYHTEAGTITDTLRVTEIEHTIDPFTWDTNLRVITKEA